MMIFDTGKREVCVARRQTTNTPLQALVLLNDPQFVEAGRALAARAFKEAPASDDERLAYSFRCLTSRRPTAPELVILRELLDEQRADFTAHPEEALAFAGEAPGGIDASDLAAQAVVANMLFSFDAAVTKR
jgi:hypothetical protein